MAKKIIPDDVTLFLENNVHIPTRTIYMGSSHYTDDGDESGVDGKLAESVLKNLHILDSVGEDGSKPITIILNNIGGDEYHGMAIYDAIQTCRNYVTIKVFGHCMSMAVPILQAADERILAPGSRLMIHYGWSGIEGHPMNVLKNAEEVKELNKLYEDLLLDRIREKHPKYTRKKLKDLMLFDKYLDAKQAINLGLADKIIGEDNE